ncbi:RDD family protein [Salinisphaera japonica]|uniref:RDD domain-containing protein n=1 Tax=Salinisphaera japonica YTM-1 TaxID=1209778 RepID=A0A423PQP6_9GAMM|nr:RDD family protein [Salinisphaera japonica]ROO27929.1 hypothetical protein SAJA_08930 [Salinisphaera japonica YTM-1]
MAAHDDSTDGESIGADWVYAGFWSRVWAAVIDSFLLLIVVFPILGWLIPGPHGPALTSGALVAPDGRIDYQALTLTGAALPGPVHVLVYWVLPALVVLLFWFFREATPGKMLIGARIVDARTGQPARTGQLVLRYLGYYVATLPLCLGLAWVGIDRRKQGWHDKLAATVVIRRPGATRPADDFGTTSHRE